MRDLLSRLSKLGIGCVAIVWAHFVALLRGEPARIAMDVVRDEMDDQTRQRLNACLELDAAWTAVAAATSGRDCLITRRYA